MTAPHRPRVRRLEAVLAAFGAALGGRAGARLAGRAGMPVSGDTLLRLLRRNAPVAPTVPRVLGVDDRAWRRGQRYGTILVDLVVGRAIDVLPGRSSDGLRDWLRAHPGVEGIARDRATAYARGATAGAPAAVPVLDRWQVLRNAREVAERILERHPDQLRALGAPAPDATAPTLPPRRSGHEESRRAGVRQRVAERHAAVQQRAAEGWSERGSPRASGSHAPRCGVTATPPRRRSAARSRPAPASSRPTWRIWSGGGPRGASAACSCGGRSARRASPAHASRSRGGRKRAAPRWRPRPRGGSDPRPRQPPPRPRQPPPVARPPGGWPGCWCASRRT